MRKRILSFFLAVCAAVSLLAVPAAAAPAVSGFTDIADRNVAAAAECLRLLGAMDGYSSGAFAPEGQVTRAQFCKIAVYAIKDGPDQLGRYRTVTKYPDVKPSYWAAPYINMASASRGGTKEQDGQWLIKGYADGRFHPEGLVTYGQAVTILMRMLGFKDEDVGGIWPDGYLSQAAAVGLTEGVASTGSAPLTRGQAAQLFVNLLRCNTSGGGNYGASIADSVVEGAMLASSSATGADGSDTAMQLGNGAVYSMANKPSTGALNGFKGMLLLKDGKVLTFVPEATASNRTVTFSSGTTSKLTTTTGESFAINGTTKMYVQSKGQETSWSEGYSWLTPGTSLTLYIGSSGGVEYIFAGGSTTATAAVVVYARGSAAGFTSLTGGNTRYSIYKNGAAATTGDLRPYDVATYSPGTNSIRVCDTRLTGIYEDCSPTPASPTSITVLGTKFTVLPTAADTISKLTIGKPITLLLTEDNQVAGAVEPNSGAPANAAGVYSKAGGLNLLCGVKIAGTLNLTDAEKEKLDGQVVSVGSSRKGVVSITKLTGGVPGDLDVQAKTMGGKLLSDNVVIYQTTSNGAQAISLSQISAARVPASGAIYARTNWAGRVDLIVLSNITGSDYIFGRLSYTAAIQTPVYDKNGNLVVDDDGDPEYTSSSSSISIIAGDKTYGPYPAVFTKEDGDDVEIHDGDYVGAKLNKEGTAVRSIFLLNEYGNVANSSWVGSDAVNIGGRSYPVPADVVCYNKATGQWVTLDQAHAFATTSTLYADKSGFIRVVVVK